MDGGLAVLRLLLVATFGAAGLLKLRRGTQFRQTVIAFGVPDRLARPVALLLPPLELVVAAALLIPNSSRWGGWGAAALLISFLAAIASNLARGSKPTCQCFGQLHASPIGPSMLARNSALLVLAVVVAIRGPGRLALNPTAWLVLSLLATTVALGRVIVSVLRQQGRLLIRIEALETALGSQRAPAPTDGAPVGLPVGSAAPDFSLAAPDGTTLTLTGLRSAGHPVLLVFSHPSCSPCRALLPELAAWQSQHADRLTIALISEKPTAKALAEAAEHELIWVGMQDGREVAEAYRCAATPGVVMVSPSGVIATPLATGADQIRSLVADFVGNAQIALGPTKASRHSQPTAAEPRLLSIGSPAPPISLPRLGGGTVALSEFRGSPALVLFWDPGCVYCQWLAPGLKALEAEPQETHHKLMIVSAGSEAANAAIGLSSPVALDDRRHAMHSYGIQGTPMAVLVDEEGAIASDIAAGEAAVLALARRVRVEISRGPGQ